MLRDENIAGAIDGTTRNGRFGSSHPESFQHILARKRLADEGEAAPSQTIRLFITLEHRNEEALEELIRDQATPGSAAYEHFLRPKEFDERFGAGPDTKRRIIVALRQAGFRSEGDDLGASIIEASGSVSAAEALFSTKLHTVRHLYAVWRTYGYASYQLGQPAVFQDITAGSNGYQAGNGYDWASGIGSLDGWALSSLE